MGNTCCFCPCVSKAGVLVGQPCSLLSPGQPQAPQHGAPTSPRQSAGGHCFQTICPSWTGRPFPKGLERKVTLYNHGTVLLLKLPLGVFSTTYFIESVNLMKVKCSLGRRCLMDRIYVKSSVPDLRAVMQISLFLFLRYYSEMEIF